jgi:hypothetical protein
MKCLDWSVRVYSCILCVVLGTAFGTAVAQTQSPTVGVSKHTIYAWKAKYVFAEWA